MSSRLSPARWLVTAAALAALAPLPAAADTINPAPPGVRPLAPRPGTKPFEYVDAPDRLPNYLAGEKWGTQGEAITRMQAPLSPEASAKRYVTQPGFTHTLFAAEPDITKPVALAWDARGRLWIAETVDYPNELQPEGKGRDRIKICEDTNGDGRADKFTVFADQLSIPTSLCFARGGLIVVEGGHTLFLQDTNGDDRADVRKVLFSGWGMGDTHATASNLRPGLDNWIWGTVGYSGFDGEVGGRRHQFGMGVYRFKADGSAMEFIRSSNNNTWGLGLSEEGIVFGSTANNNASWYMAIPNRFYEAVAGWSASRMETIANSQQFFPVTDKVRQVDAHGRYTAGAGHALYTARAFPAEFWNRIAFVAEPTGHLVGWFRLDPDGADFKAVNLGSFLASDDEWSAPIVAEVGPDGAVWVIDWYNYIIQHNPVPIGFQNGKGNAYETTLRDKRHGRIYRVAPTQPASSQPAPKLDQATPANLVAALRSDNQLWRMHAQQRLVDRAQTDVVPGLLALLADPAVDAAGLNPGAIHAIWTLRGLLSGEPSGDAATALAGALRHSSAGVRRAVYQAFPDLALRTAAAADWAPLREEKHPQVRLAALLALAEVPPREELGALVARVLQHEELVADRWLREAATAAAARHLEGFGRALLTSDAPLPAQALEVVRVVARHYATPAPDSIVQVLTAAARMPAPTAKALLDGLLAGWPAARKPDVSEEAARGLTSAMSGLAEPARDTLLALAAKWERLDLFSDELTAARRRLAARLANDTVPDAERVEAARNLLRLADEPAQVKAVLGQVTLNTPPALATGLIGALGESRAAGTAPAILEAWPQFTPAQKRAALGTLLRRTAWAGRVLDALEAGALHEKDLDWGQWQGLRNNADAGVAGRAKAFTGRGNKLSADREAVVKQFRPAAQKAGDATRGKAVFTQNCAVCHLFYGQGGKVGPDLSGIGARAKDEILAEILDPNRSVEANYVLWTLETKGGESLSGRLDTETQTSIELYDLQGQKHAVLRKDIATLQSSRQSIMPTGFEQIGEQGLSDLLAYLATRP